MLRGDCGPANTGDWLAFAGQILVGAGMLGRHEIYIWKIGEPEESTVRLTFHTGEDCNRVCTSRQRAISRLKPVIPLLAKVVR